MIRLIASIEDDRDHDRQDDLCHGVGLRLCGINIEDIDFETMISRGRAIRIVFSTTTLGEIRFIGTGSRTAL